MKPMILTIAAGVASLLMTATAPVLAQQAPMTFFITSTGSPKGADFGGLSGADALCQSLAQAVGAGGKTWAAYLSTQPSGKVQAVNARDRIGPGPWVNAQGQLIAKDVADLHGNNSLNKQTALTEKGTVVSGRGDPVNVHDILTGSLADGTAFPAGIDRTCGNWTKDGAEGSAMVGHSDRIGLRDDDSSHSWNSSHPSRGCSVEALKLSGGGGLLYCFAVK